MFSDLIKKIGSAVEKFEKEELPKLKATSSAIVAEGVSIAKQAPGRIVKAYKEAKEEQCK